MNHLNLPKGRLCELALLLSVGIPSDKEIPGILIYLYDVKKEKVNIDFNKMAESYKKYVRKKATLAGSSIIYVQGNKLIKENPGTLTKKILFENIADIK